MVYFVWELRMNSSINYELLLSHEPSELSAPPEQLLIVITKKELQSMNSNSQKGVLIIDFSCQLFTILHPITML